MDTICDHLVLDHKRCDHLFAQAENSVSERNWKNADASFRQFYDALKQHIRMEEKVLFPAFEQTIRHGDGPIAMLRIEHQQMRGMVERMHDALRRFDAVDFLLHSETFILLMQQHSMKEEVLLYPLLDKALAGRRDKVIHAMAEYMEINAPSVSD